jgi:hypothetical protein
MIDGSHWRTRCNAKLAGGFSNLMVLTTILPKIRKGLE